MALRLPTPLTPLWPRLKVAYTHATRTVAPFTRQLSRIRGGFLPLGAVSVADESIADAGGKLWTTRSEERVRRAMPAGEPPQYAKFAHEGDLQLPRVAIAELPSGRVLGPHRVVIDRRGRMIEEFGPYWGTTQWSEHRVFWHPFPGPPLEVEGLMGVLAGRGDLNYFHFFMDILPRLAMFEASGVPTPEHWYVPLQHGFQREALELAGFLPKARVIDADTVPHVRAERLLVPSLPNVHKRVPPWTVAFLRERLKPPEVELVPGRRIYITRGRQRHNRTVRNEPEVVEMLADRGFVVVDPGTFSVADQITMFAEAEWIVSPHGAGLTNLLFASPGASVIEIFAPDYVDAGFWKLADSVPGLSYRYLIGVGDSPDPGRDETGIMSDITVDLPALKRALD